MRERTWKAWTMKDIAMLRELSEQGKSNKEIAEIMDRSVKSIVGRKGLAKIAKPNDWTKEEEAMLREMVEQGMTVRHMASQIGRSFVAVREKKSRLGLRLSKPHSNRLKQEKRISFSKEEYKDMREDYEDRTAYRMTCKQIAKKYNLSDQVLRRIARKRGWTRKRAGNFSSDIEFAPLFKAYYEDCLSVYAMKKRFQCSERKIYSSLESHGLEKLSKEERIKIRDEFSDRDGVPKTKRLSKETSK
ncbi:luxR family bacterial regulatory protein [Exiguobacterium phage vB_EauM-23]|nr:luxR family bacterial regulatory protein [Exiguobacterium phage vB_EauM-23]